MSAVSIFQINCSAVFSSEFSHEFEQTNFVLGLHNRYCGHVQLYLYLRTYYVFVECCLKKLFEEWKNSVFYSLGCNFLSALVCKSFIFVVIKYKISHFFAVNILIISIEVLYLYVLKQTTNQVLFPTWVPRNEIILAHGSRNFQNVFGLFF